MLCKRQERIPLPPPTKRTSENACPFCLIYYVRGIRTPYHEDDRKRREKQALAFAEIERSGHSQQPDTKCQMQGNSAKARLLSVDASLLRVNSLAPLLNESSSSAKQNGQAFFACPFCFSVLNKRDSNESVKKTTRCVVFSGCPKAFAKHKNC